MHNSRADHGLKCVFLLSRVDSAFRSIFAVILGLRKRVVWSSSTSALKAHCDSSSPRPRWSRMFKAVRLQPRSGPSACTHVNGAPRPSPGTPISTWGPENDKACRPAHHTYPGVINLIRSFNLNVQRGPHLENSAAPATSCSARPQQTEAHPAPPTRVPPLSPRSPQLRHVTSRLTVVRPPTPTPRPSSFRRRGGPQTQPAGGCHFSSRPAGRKGRGQASPTPSVKTIKTPEIPFHSSIY